MRRDTTLRLAALALFVLAGCQDAPVGPPTGPPSGSTAIDIAAPWQVASPGDVGLNSFAMSLAVSAAADIDRLRSLLVVKDGKLVVEEYFGGRGAGSLNDVRSVTKSIVGTLAALARDRGYIASLDDPIDRYLPAEVTPLDFGQRAITVRHLLTMSGGFQWDESGGGGDYVRWILSDDPIGMLLDRPIEDSPGSGFTYNSAAVHLLGVLIEEAVGEPLPAFAARELFQPLGISSVEWEPMSDGFVNGGSGIDLRARDLARLGQLYLQDGVSGGRRILPEGWVAEATRPWFSWRATFGALGRYTYGELWWVSEGRPETAFLAWGYGGQFIYVVPALDLVVVTTTEWTGLSQEGGPGGVERDVLDVVVGRIHEAAAR